MITKFRRVGLSIGALAAVLAVAAPALAQNHGGGGGGSGHFSGGGGHASGGGGHMSAGHGSGSFASGGHGFSGGHAAGYSGHAYNYAGGGRGFQGGTHFAPTTHYGYGGGGNWGGGWHGGYGGGWHGGNWGGGYWHGGYWPRAYYGFGFSWFLPVLPLAYATYWWDGLPYYYANSVYYTWNPAYDGYVVTDPPPVADGAGVAAGSSAAPGGDQIFMYPRNGQSDAQLATDRTECQQWAASQAGGGDEYRRAMTACAEARGYSAK